ncbi:putative ankyrin repeat protein RF_0381 [Gigantopelta aegis]|uniref:putative ankyrin repeat protein RF_0381 n=1 Tax=Gigantopelta aegis TaxID=1735272 RepID=UPI001B88CB5C|nr:putative ankyrin repeat protein RF_0381 [Gigantopelta aegis]
MIHMASACGHVDVVRCLIQKGCDVDAVCLETETTPLMFASNRGHLKVVELLVENGADILRVNKENDCGLHLACRANHEDIVRFFLNSGMDVDCRGEHGRTPIMFACRFGYERLVSYLLSKTPDVYAIPRKDYNHNCLHLACINGSVTIVQALFDYGMDIDVISLDQRRTPVMFACRHGQLQVVRRLMHCRANMTKVDIDGLTCLHLAAMSDNVDLIELLVSTVRLDIDCQSRRGITALMSAASKGFVEAFFCLIKHGSNPYAFNHNKETLLHMAARGGSVQISDWLLKKGKALQVNRKCRRGSSPLDIAMKCSHLELIDLFKSWSGHMS